jgi:hypothetical protein
VRKKQSEFRVVRRNGKEMCSVDVDLLLWLWIVFSNALMFGSFKSTGGVVGYHVGFTHRRSWVRLPPGVDILLQFTPNIPPCTFLKGRGSDSTTCVSE